MSDGAEDAEGPDPADRARRPADGLDFAHALPILALGTLTLDTVETPADRRERAPGGSALYFAAAAGLLAPVRVMGVVGEDFPEAGLDALEEGGAALDGVSRLPGPTMSWHARYGPDLSHRETLAADRGVLARWEPAVPGAWRDTPVVFLGSTDPALQAAVLEQVPGPELVAADSMAHWIADRRDEVEAIAARSDLFLASTEECRMLGGDGSIGVGGAAPHRRSTRVVDAARDAARGILDMGPRWVVEKRGAGGAVLHGRDARRAVPAFPVKRVVDPTGAGDAFAGGLVGWIAAEGGRRPATDDAPPGDDVSLRDSLDPDVLIRALAAGAAAASFAVEGFSVEGLEGATLDDLQGRMAAVERATDG